MSTKRAYQKRQPIGVAATRATISAKRVEIVRDSVGREIEPVRGVMLEIGPQRIVFEQRLAEQLAIWLCNKDEKAPFGVTHF